jgi:hypothetical protein
MPVAADGWTMAPVASAASTTAVPPLVPVLCRGFLTSVYANGAVQTLDVDATAACSDQVDELDYSWTWIDATTGQVLWSSGTHSVTNTATLFASSSSSAGSFGNRDVQLCITTYKAGYDPGGKCLEVFNS